MNAFEGFVAWLQGGTVTPAIFGWYHILCVLSVAALTLFLCLRYRDADERAVRRILLLAWIVMLIAESYKQLVFSMDIEGGLAVWDYTWYAFPYQFCSTPIYVLPFAIFLKKGRVRDAALAFMMSFSLFGGLVVMVYPGDVYMQMIGINLQTMIHHGLQVTLGIYLLSRYRRHLGLKHLLSGACVFAVTAAVALALDIGVYHALAARFEEVPTFNMFFISPYFDCTLPILSLVHGIVPYPVFLMIYLVGFCLAALLVYMTGCGITRLSGGRNATKE